MFWTSWMVGITIYLVVIIVCLVFISIAMNENVKMNKQLKNWERDHRTEVEFSKENPEAIAKDNKIASNK